MAYTGLSKKIAEYIQERAKEKLEKFDKEAEKKRQSALSEAELTKLSKELAEKRRHKESTFSPEVWLSEQAKNASKVHKATHVAKLTHTGASDASNIFEPPEGDLGINTGLISTKSLLNRVDDWAVDNAAFAPIAALLQLSHNGKSLIEYIEEGDGAPLRAFAQSEEQCKEWVKQYHHAIEITEPASHTFMKQVYFPISKDHYHLIAPLSSSALSQALFERIQESKFGDNTREARKRKKENRYSKDLVIDFPNIAVQKIGGDNPQNVSQLNGKAKRNARAYLLNCAPPRWQPQSQPPLKLKNIIDGPYSYRVRRETRHLQQFLLFQVGRESTWEVRTKRAQRIDHLIDELIQFGAEIQQIFPGGWSELDECLLPQHQRLWLDPGRKRQDKNFAKEREKNDWPQQVADDFGTWLNQKLKHEKLAMSEVEHREWKSLVARKLRLLKDDLGAFT